MSGGVGGRGRQEEEWNGVAGSSSSYAQGGLGISASPALLLPASTS